MFEAVIIAAKKAGILVMLDMHLLRNNTAISELWYDENFSEAEVIQAWQALLHRCAHSEPYTLNLSSRPGTHVPISACTGALHLTLPTTFCCKDAQVVHAPNHDIVI